MFDPQRNNSCIPAQAGMQLLIVSLWVTHCLHKGNCCPTLAWALIANDGPLLVVFRSSFPTHQLKKQQKQTNKTRWQGWTPSVKTVWIRAWPTKELIDKLDKTHYIALHEQQNRTHAKDGKNNKDTFR